jgi:hypothetical protein
MPKVTVYLNNDIFQDLKNISNNSGKSISKISAELIERSIKEHSNQQNNEHNLNDNKKINPHEKKHLIYSWTTLNLVIEILRKLKNEPSSFDDKNTNYIATTIKNMVTDKLKDV